MTELDEIVGTLRTALADIPAAVTFADLPNGRAIGSESAEIPPALRDLLLVTDGPRCGSIVVFAMSELDDNQFYCDELAGGTTNWLCYGMIDDNPLFLNRADEDVWWFPGGVAARINGRLARLADDLATFVTRYLFGEQYPEVVTGGAQDRWYAFRQNVRAG